MKQLFNFLIAALLLISCSKGNDSESGRGNGGAQKGVINGKITDPSGNALAGVKVYADHHTYYNTNVIGVTNEKGEYSLNMKGQPAGSWSIHGEYIKTYNNISFTFRIEPANADPLTTTDGGVRDMKWQLTGTIPGTTDDSRIGGYVTFMSDDFTPAEEVEFHLEPIGALVDGSTGQTIIRRAENFPYHLNGLYDNKGLRDIPVGRYKISAVHKPAEGAPMDLLVSKRGGAYASSITADFGQEAPNNYQEIDLNIKGAVE